eukprot:191107_1
MNLDKIYTSAYTRSQQTCKIIVNQLQYNNISQIIIDSDLNEGCPDIMEPLKKHRTLEDVIEDVEKTSPPIKNAFNAYFNRRNEEDMNPNNDKQREDILVVDAFRRA